jgi:hypothetical protein
MDSAAKIRLLISSAFLAGFFFTVAFSFTYHSNDNGAYSRMLNDMREAQRLVEQKVNMTEQAPMRRVVNIAASSFM